MKKVDFVWMNDFGWKWEAKNYEGNGIFYGKVTSPIVPEGEYGTWYLWEIEEDDKAKLVKGDMEFINEVKKKLANAMEIQKTLMGKSKKNLQENVI